MKPKIIFKTRKLQAAIGHQVETAASEKHSVQWQVKDRNHHYRENQILHR